MRIAVILFNLGGPDCLDAVEPFLFNLFNDPAIITTPWPVRPLLAKLISSRRAPIAKETYKKLGGGSPLVANTQAQAEALSEALGDIGEVKCFQCMRYWNPRSAEVVRDVISFAPDQVVLLPLYPQYSTTTTASSFREWRKTARSMGLKAPTREICCYPRQPGFVGESAALIRDSLAKAPGDTPPRVLFSAHGLPQKFVDKGDPYKHHVELSAKAIVDALGIENLDWRICFQSRVGPLEWIRPYLEDEISEAGAAGIPIVLFPLAFVSEHAETLIELDVEFKNLAETAGAPSYIRVKTVGVGAAFIDGLANIVRHVVSNIEDRPIVSSGDENDNPCQGMFPGCELAAK
jgi:protoporphyrin/coproporphyrin ferrochelatase